MFMKRKSLFVSLLVFTFLTGNLLNAQVAQAAPKYVEGSDPAAILFDPLMVNNFNLQMSEVDFDSLRSPNVAWDREGDWRETRMSFTMAGKVFGPYVVGVHLKGAWGSWRDVSGKAAFKIKMDEFVTGQTLFGVTNITLNNMVQDPSYMHESITYRLFRNLGIPTPRTGYANVSLNGINYGLHLNVETPNKQMLKRWNISSSHLYKGAVPYFPDFNQGSESMFAVESGSQTDYSDLTAFMVLNQLNGKAWWDAMSKITDMGLLTTGWATEYYTGHWDGYVLNKNNYFVNFDNEGKVLLLLWGVDQTWNGSLDYFNSSALMPNKCWSYAPCLELYRQSMAKVARVAKKLDLPAMASAIYAAISPDIARDPFGTGSSAADGPQAYLQWRLRDQLSVLANAVKPYDTTLSIIQVAGRSYQPGETIYLDPGTRVVSIKALATQANATVSLQPVATLMNGMNTANFVVTSPDRAHVNSHVLSLYVYTDKMTKSTVLFHTNTAVPTFGGTSNLGTLGTSLSKSKDIVLTIQMVKPKTLTTVKAKAVLSGRVKHVLLALSKRGIVPTKTTQALITSGTSNSLRISASHTN
jgi:hypothetical protein